MSILAIETSTSHGSVAVLDADGSVLFAESFVADRTHSSALFACVLGARAAVASCEQIAVGLGPGSYAGVRIAISAAIGLSLTTGAKLVGLASIAALDVEANRYAAIGDARRESYYWSLVEAGVCLEGPELVSEAELRQRLERLDAPVFTSEPLSVAPQALVAYPSACRLAALASQRRGVLMTGDLEPIYLREPHITQPKRII